MTRETKLGIVVAGAFVSLLTVVVYHKIQENDSPPVEAGQVLRSDPKPTPPKKTPAPVTEPRKANGVIQAGLIESPGQLPALPAVAPVTPSSPSVPTPPTDTKLPTFTPSPKLPETASSTKLMPDLPKVPETASSTKLMPDLPPVSTSLPPVSQTDDKRPQPPAPGLPQLPMTPKHSKLEVPPTAIQPVGATQTELPKSPTLPLPPVVAPTAPVVAPPPELPSVDKKDQAIKKTLQEEVAKSNLSGLPPPTVNPPPVTVPPVDNKTPAPAPTSLLPLAVPPVDNKLLTPPPTPPVTAPLPPGTIPVPATPLPPIDAKLPGVGPDVSPSAPPAVPPVDNKTPSLPAPVLPVVSPPTVDNKTPSTPAPVLPVVPPVENKTSFTPAPVPPVVPPMENKTSSLGTPNHAAPAAPPPLVVGTPKESLPSMTVTVPPDSSIKPVPSAQLAALTVKSTNSLPAGFDPYDSKKAAAYQTTAVVKVIDVENYKCQAGDTFESVSQQKYSSKDFARALLEYNRDNNKRLPAELFKDNAPVLQAGMVVQVPPLKSLQQDEKYQKFLFNQNDAKKSVSNSQESFVRADIPSLPNPGNPPLPPVGPAVTTVGKSIDVPPPPSRRPTVGIKPMVKVTELGIYTCQAGDTFESVSQQKYSSRDFARALLEYNRDNNKRLPAELFKDNVPVLQAGMVVQIPPLASLQEDEKYQKLLAKPFVPQPAPNGPSSFTVSNSPGLPKVAALPNAPTSPQPSAAKTVVPVPTAMPLEGVRQYQVQGRGEMMFEIALKMLGDGDRWSDIYRLNPQLNPQLLIPAGTTLRLP